MSNQAKKKEERSLIEEARRRSTIFPPGELTPHESPDWLIPSALVAIEVSKLLRPKCEDEFSGAQLHSFQREVVERGRQFYTRHARPDVDVLVFFQNEWNCRRDLQALASDLAEFVSRNLPAEGATVTLQPRDVEDWIEGLSVVRISRRVGRWQAGGAGHGVMLEYSDIASRIATKNQLVPQYRARAPHFAIWLLLATEIRVL